MNQRKKHFPLSFKLGDEYKSEDHSIQGKLVFDGEGEPYITYYEKKDVKLVKLDYHTGDWEKVK